MRLSGSERIYSVRKKAGHSEAEEEIVSAAAEHSASGGTSAPESSLYRRIHLLIWSLFFFFLFCRFPYFHGRHGSKHKKKALGSFRHMPDTFPIILGVLVTSTCPNSVAIGNHS